MWASGSDQQSVEITIILIVVSSLVTIVVRRTKRDKCLKDFSRYPVMLQTTDGATFFGRLHVENTGIELAYADKQQRESGNTEASYWGVLKEYTKEFIEVMDVEYSLGGDRVARKADLVVPRARAWVRHLGE